MALGHDIGLHMDVGFFGEYFEEETAMDQFLATEKTMLESLFSCDIKAVSFHQPELRKMTDVRQPEYHGMINAYSQTIFDRYSYCSDSNGYWRFRPLEEVLLDTAIPSPQVLTHPAWWTPEAASPAQRIMRTLRGRSEAVWQRYCGELDASHQENVGVDEISNPLI